jgi:YVTN family beta-propeller protein
MVRAQLRRYLTAVFCALALASQTGSAADGYHFLKKIKIGGEGWWDYLTADAANRRLYVSHGSQVEVLDLDSGEILGRIPAQGVHGIAVAADLNRGFVSNGQSNTVTIFDLKTRDVIGTVKTGANPDAIIYDPSGRRVFAFNGRGANATVIDASTGNVLATIDLGGKPEFAAADGKGNVYVNVEDKSQVVHIDSKLTAQEHWPLAPCEEPPAMAMDTSHGRLFVGCGNKMMAIVDASSGHVITTAPIGEGVDAAGFDPDAGLAFASNGDGTVTVIREESPNRFSVIENVKTQRGARTMALDKKTHNVYLSIADFEPRPAGATGRPKAVADTFGVLVFGK